MKKNYVFDACALIAFLAGEQGAEVVESLLKEGARGLCDLYIHKLNLLEIYYGVFKADGEEIADKVYENILRLPLHVTDGFDEKLFKEAGRLKASYKISLADAVALAETKKRKALLVTCDHHEFDVIDRKGEVHFYWIR